jgi:RIO-like serine/threonine protein kinase
MFTETNIHSFAEQKGTILRKPTSTRPAIWLLEENGKRAIMKDFSKNRFLYRNIVGRFLVWREGKAYRKLQGIRGVPALYRIVDGTALIFEAIRGNDMETLEKGKEVPESFFDALNDLISLCHERGVAHCDLKRAPNTILGDDGRPYIVDWAASIFRDEFRIPPMNLIYRRFMLDDRMAVIKLKLRHSPKAVTQGEKDRYYYRSKGEILIRAARDKLRELLQRAV